MEDGHVNPGKDGSGPRTQPVQKPKAGTIPGESCVYSERTALLLEMTQSDFYFKRILCLLC